MKSIPMKIVGMISLGLLLITGIYLWKTEIGDDEVFILPEGHKGIVFILFDQKNGEPERYEHGSRVYEIPPGGVLKTQFFLNTGWHRPGKYFYRVNGKLVEIPYVFDDRDMDIKNDRKSEVHVCCPSNGQAGREPNGPAVVYEQFYVGTKDEINSASEERERTNPAELIN